MITGSNIEFFLEKYFATKNLQWLELFIYEFYKHKTDEIIAQLEQNEKFGSLATQISYHLLELLFTTISDLTTNNTSVLCLRNLLTLGLGGKIIVLISDLHLFNMTNERELVNVLTKVFPNDFWECADELSATSRLSVLSHDDIKNIFSKEFNLLKSNSSSCSRAHQTSMNSMSEVDSEEVDINKFLSDDFKAYNESFHISSAELSIKIIQIFHKLLEIDRESSVDRNSMTISCLNFSIDTLKHLSDRNIFNEYDQTVIKIKITQLICQCFSSLVKRDCKNLKWHVKKLFNLLEMSAKDKEVTCGLIMCIITTMANLCIKKSSQKVENLELLKLCSHLVLKQMEILDVNGSDFLFIIQRRLMKILKMLKKVQASQKVRKKKKAKKIDIKKHHHSHIDACIFERLLIDSFPFIKSYKHLKSILSHLNNNSICCCNGDVRTIEIFMRSSLIAPHYLRFIEEKIIRVMFEKSKICIYCNDKINSIEFTCGYFRLLRSEMVRRKGYELYALLNHITIIQKLMSKEFRYEFIFKVIVMMFVEEKEKYLSDTDAYQESRLKATICLRIITENSNDSDFLKKFLTLERINHLRDCSLIPAMSMSACVILSNGLKLLDDQNVINSIKSIFFSNILYLIHELIAIYDEIDLPRDLPLSRHDSGISSSKLTSNSTGDTSDFEVLDQQTVVVKENLSNLDVLLLNMVHWNILSELIVKFSLFQAEFIANIHNNFHKNILFTIAYHALNAMLLRREISYTNISIAKNTQKNQNEEQEADLSKHLIENIHASIICPCYDLNYESVIRRSFKLFEICQHFCDKLQKECEENTCCMLYRIQRDNTKFINLAVHRDNFLPGSFTNVLQNSPSHESFHHQNWIYSFGTYLDKKFIKDTISKVLHRFMRTDEELKVIHRLNTIKEITGKFGLKYLSAIARNCFDISFRLSSSHSINTKMSTALDELKLLLLQSEVFIDNDNCESKKAIVDALQLLLGVAEMKTRGVDRMMFLNFENHIESTTESIFSELNASCETGIKFSPESSDDDDDSGDRRTENYFTGDENYDADEEYFSIRNETICSQSFKTASENSAMLNVKNTNEHLCRLVVEILMELSKKFNESDLEAFIALGHRLSCMKDYLGGAEFLLKGFAPLLTRNEKCLKEFQHAILELVDEINTPNSLRNLFSILSEQNAPIELVISRMEVLCNKENYPRPFCAVKYPIYCSETIVTSTCDTYVNGLIQSLKNNNKSRSPFVEASQIIPLNFFEINIWNSNAGYTISTWVELETCQGTSKIHLFSIGSEKLILAVFLNPDGTFDFIVIKPNSHHSHKSKAKGTKIFDTQQSSSTSSDHFSSDKENINKTNIFGIATAILRDRESANIRTRGSLKHKKSLKDDENSKQMETSRVKVKSKKSKLKCHSWTHVCLSLRSNESQVSILLTLNATEHENIEIPIDGMNSEAKDIKSDIVGELQLLFIGSTISEQNSNDTSYCMSNVTFFKTPLDAYLIAFLYALGPNCSNFSNCEINQIMPLRGTLDLTKLVNRITLKMASQDLIKLLKSNVLLTYAVGKSSGYATGYLKGDYGKPLEIFTNGYSPTSLPIKSIARAVYFSGGLSNLLFLFARTVELTGDPETQSIALYIFLKMAYSNNFLYAEFEQKNLFNLVAHVFKHGNCYRGPGMLKAILDVIFGGTMFNKKSSADEYQINEKSELNIQNPSLLMKLLANFGIFQTTDQTDACNLDLLFMSLKVATRETHPYKHINRQCLLEHGFYERLIEFCKINLTNSHNSVTLTSSTAIILVDLLKMLSKNPPIWIVSRIQELLMLLHHPSESFITHDRSKFNFILSNQKPTKINRNTTIGSKFYFNFSTKIRATNTSSLPASPTSSHRSSINNGSPPKSPKLISSGDINSIFNEIDGKPMSFRGSTDSAASTISTPKFKTQKLDQLSEIQTQKIAKIFIDLKANKSLRTPTKINKKRLKNSPRKSPFKKVIIKKKSIEIGDEVDQTLIEKFETLMSASSIQISEIFNRYEAGICVLQENLFVMLKEAILSINDNKAQMEVSESMSIESLIMFSNHPDGNVRCAIIELIQTIVARQSQEMLNFYQKSNYWTHLGNQLAISPVNYKVIETCINWILLSEKFASLDEILQMEKIEIKFKMGFRILLSMIPSTTYDTQLFMMVLNFLKILMNNNDSLITLADYGLVNSLIRSLMKVDDEDALESLQVILENIATKALTTTASINVLWELLYGLTYAERQGTSSIAIKDIHIGVLHQILSICIVEQARRGSKVTEVYPSLVVTKTLGNLPSSEIKTRFNLIHDRAVHYIISWEEIKELTTFEIDFVKYLIELYFSGIHQGSTLLLWALNPTCNDEVKQFLTHKIIAMLTIDPNFTISEPKLLKALLYHLIINTSSSFSEEQLKVVNKYCGTTLSQQQQNFGWILTAIEKVDILRQNAQRDQSLQVDKIVYKHETFVQAIIDGAMKITRDVIDMQNRERRQLMNYLKRTQEIDYYREWSEVIQRMTHESAPWHNPQLYPNTFELDETEGPGRVRIRLKRTTLKIDEKFFIEDFKHKASYQHKKPLLNYLLHPKETERYSINDQIIFTFNGKHLTLEQEIEGEIIVTDNQLNFLANKETYTNSIICNIYEIDEVWDRRYQHKEIALEIFLKSSKNFFLIFESKYERDIVTKFLSDKIDKKDMKVEAITQKWIENKLTNYEYLIELNKISGRSYNDLMQYPVFPWIITDYSSDVLDLTVAESYRKLNKTISTQYEETEEHYVNNYNYLVQQMSECQSILKPYHYSSHYSNSGTVLHFLVRMPPFTNMFLLYQDHNFDIPDRTFHSLATTYRLTSKESATDVKELIPEFFYLPDFLINNEGFNYGMRQSGEQVNDIKLPPWCDESARLFVLIHRQALESDFVRKKLNQWIDLIFGFRQKGKAAVDAVNVFHPATYPEFQITNITDLVERSAYETMVRTYGQMPKQIFTSPHKKSSALEKANDLHFVLRGVKGLKWGNFTGSPQLPKPRKFSAKMPIPNKQRNTRLVPVHSQNMFFVIPSTSCLMQGTSKNFFDLILWNENDGVVRTKSLNEKKTRKLFNAPICDPITTCGTDVNYSNIWFGHQSGNISVYVRIDERQKLKKKQERIQKTLSTALESIIDIKVDKPSTDDEINLIKSRWNFPIILLRHSSEVTSIKICTEFKIVVSIGADGRTVIWDSQKIEYIQTIEPSCNSLRSCLTHVDISPTLGDILTAFRPKSESHDGADCFEVVDNINDDFINISMSIAGKSQLRLHNINAKYIGHTFVEGIVVATCFSFMKEGTGINVIAVALSDGYIRLYSTWNLEFIREIATACNRIAEISFSPNHYLTILSDQEIHVWGTDGLPTERPSFHDIIFE